VVATWQLLPLGYTYRAIHGRERTGRLHRRRRGVYAVGHPRLSLRGEWMAAVLACGPEAVLSHYCAAALWNLQRPPSTRIDVTASSGHRLQGVRTHKARSLLQHDRTVIDGIPVTSIYRTLLDQAAQVPEQRLLTTVEDAQRRDLLDMRQLHDLLARSHGHRGVKPLTRAVAKLTDDPPWLQSTLERDFLELVRAAGLPEPSANVVICGEVVDFYWPRHHLVVELDGFGAHGTRRAFADNRRRDVKLQLAGERVVRFVHEQVQHTPNAVITDVRGLLGSTTA